MKLEQLHLRAKTWHEVRFPEARKELVALKLCEEAGEVASAILGQVGKNSATGKGDVVDEISDVFIASLVLLSRWFPEINILDEIDAKLTLLESRGSLSASLV